ncbi:restriction endonuclease subunit S [Streptococcus oralis]|uniref:restriction endonuclease subunit S n=1 Tax=Streptococcus oralis TaxID=1303 RepID=UPI000A11D3E3|nr:restriction endonuclease subunit S [Streptococcus oralis]ORO81861.1 restriction endonuclease subunit S [Streptococcus oralis subsp. dentisani]
MSKVVKLEELCLPDQIGKYGIPAVAEEFSEDKVRYLRITDIDDYGNLLENDKKSVSSPEIEKYILKEGDIVFARTGNSTGRTYFHEEKNGELAFAGFLIKFSLDESKVNPKYLKYFTISRPYKQWVDNLSNGSTRGNINAKTFADCPIILPSRAQQDYLVRVLSSLEEKVQINNQINQELEAMAKTLYDYWFVQFDFPDQNGKPYKSSGGKMVYHPELKREIPEGWEVETLKDFESKIITGKTPSRANSDNFGGEIPFITIGDIRGNTFIYSTSETLTDLGASVQQNKYLPEGSLCVSCIATVGEIGFTTEWSHTNQQINSIVFEDETNRYYLYFALKNYFENANASAKTGNTFANMNKEDFSGIRIILPRNEIKNNFHKITEPYFAQIKCLQGQNQELTQLRDWLLPMLMNGQVKVE